MRKVFTLEQRKRMLERLDDGATYTELKREFNIKDTRTLEKQLVKGREEQSLRIARTEIIKQSLQEHLNEVKSLIERWKDSIKAPSFPSCSRPAAEDVSQSRLFVSLSSHLPYRELWKIYDDFEAEWDEYVVLCEKTHKKALEDAHQNWGIDLLPADKRVPGLLKWFSGDTLEHAMKIMTGDRKPRDLRYEVGTLGDKYSNLQYLECDTRVLLYATDAEEFEAKHRQMVLNWAKSEEIASLHQLLNELREMEANLHRILEESLLRRDHILYTCRFCPGERKLT